MKMTVMLHTAQNTRESLAAEVTTSASEVTTLWRYTNLFIIIIIIINFNKSLKQAKCSLQKQSATAHQ